MGVGQGNHYNLRNQKAAAIKSTKTTHPSAKTKVKAASPKKAVLSKKATLKTPENQKILTSPRDTKQRNNVSPRLLGSLVKTKLLVHVAKQDLGTPEPVKTAIISPFVTFSRGKQFKLKKKEMVGKILRIAEDFPRLQTIFFFLHPV